MPAAAVKAELETEDPFQGLTSKQYRFVQAVFSGLSNAAAYRQVYDCEGLSESVVGRLAHSAAREPLVRAKLQEMRQRMDDESVLLPFATKSFVIQRLVHLSLNGDKDSVRLGATTQLGKVAGIDAFRETTRVEHITRTQEEVDRELKEMIANTAKTIEGAAIDVPEPTEPARRKRQPKR